jgi:hypothetical protein
MSRYTNKYKQWAPLVDYSIGRCRAAAGKPYDLMVERYRHWGLMKTLRKMLGL